MFSSKKPYSAVTVAVENFTGERFEEDDLSGIPDLVEAINLQASGPTEAARAIRKKLKYGNIHRQLRALVLLDGLIQNAGGRFQRTFADEMLLERLRVCGTSDLSDPLVREKCKVLFRSWAAEHKNTRGLEQIAALYKQLPTRKQVVTQDKSKVIRETDNPFEDDEDKEDEPPTPSYVRQPSASQGQSSQSNITPWGTPMPPGVDKKSKKEKEKDKKGKKGKNKPFNLEAEKETMKACIGDSTVVSTNLLNALRLINRENERISENQAAVQHFDNCKLLRRKILRYIQNVEAEQWLGALLDANDRLVTALMTFEQLDRSIDADSDSDDEMAEQAHAYKIATVRAEKEKGKEPEPTHQFSGLSIGKSPVQELRRPPPARATYEPPPVVEEDEDDFEEADDDDPFADRNAVETPAVEKSEPRWR